MYSTIVDDCIMWQGWSRLQNSYAVQNQTYRKCVYSDNCYYKQEINST